MWSGGAPQQYGGAAAANQKNDIFVGNLAFNTTEEQLHQAFSEIGRVINVRLVTDVETGKPRGFAFVEFQDAQAALSAIRNMNNYELNGRSLRVNFSNSSHLEALAGKLGMDLSSTTPRSSTQTNTAGAGAAGTITGTNAVVDSLKAMSKAEMYDVVAKLKEIADRDPDEARRLLSGHPQLPEALLFLMAKLDMVKTPIATEQAAVTTAVAAPAVLPPPPVAAAPAPRDPRAAARVDPRAAAAASKDPRANVADPRSRSADPRQQARSADPRSADPRSRAAGALPPPPPPPPRATGGFAAPPPPPPPRGVDPALAQQVMSLTPQQIQQLPPDKQQSIMQLRNQIMGGR